MNEQWLKRIQERVANHEQKAPEGLWNEIERSLDEMALPEKGGHRKNIIPVLSHRWHVVAAAIVVLLIITGSIIFFDIELKDNAHENYASTPSHENPSATNDVLKISEARLDVNVNNKMSEMTVSANVGGANVLQIVDSAGIGTVNENIMREERVTVNQGIEVDSMNDEDNHQKYFVFGNGNPNYKNNGDDYKMSEVNTGINEPGKWKVGLYASNSINSDNSTSSGYRNFKIGANPFAVVPEKTHWSHDAMANIMLNNLNTQTTTDIKHHLPVRVGVSVNYAFTDRWGVESGLAYTILASDLRSGSANDYYETKQKLHYLGIPLKANFKIWGNEHFAVYAAAGGMLEIPVAGQSRTNYVNSGQVAGNDSENVNPGKLQWSVNANVGVQYNISNVFGIYLEPGVGYYFDDGSDVLTIYKEKKWNFDFQLGVRFNLNN